MKLIKISKEEAFKNIQRMRDLEERQALQQPSDVLNVVAPTEADAGLLLYGGKGGESDKYGLRKVNSDLWEDFRGNKIQELPTTDIADDIEAFRNEGGDSIPSLAYEKAMYTTIDKGLFGKYSKTQEFADDTKNDLNYEYYIDSEKLDPNTLGATAPSRGIQQIYINNMYSGGNTEAGTVVHEMQHTLQQTDKDNPYYDIIGKSKLPYEKQGYEAEARQVANRVNFPPELTNPKSKYGIHPYIYVDYSNPKGVSFEVDNARDMVASLASESKDMKSDDALINAQLKLARLQKEANRLQKMYNQDADFRKLVDSSNPIKKGKDFGIAPDVGYYQSLNKKPSLFGYSDRFNPNLFGSDPFAPATIGVDGKPASMNVQELATQILNKGE